MTKKFLGLFFGIILIGILIYGFLYIYIQVKYPLNYKAEIVNASVTYEIEPYIVAAMINVESSFNKDSVSSKGAVGLMQILPSTASWIAEKLNIEDFKTEDLHKPQLNILFGTFYLKYLFSKYDNRTTAFCAYNAGEGVVNGWLNNAEYSQNGITLDKIPFLETEKHIQKLQQNLKIYKNKF